MSRLAFSTINRGHQQWVVWLHGFLGTSGDLRPLAEQLAPRYNALLVDLPGHGDSVHVDPVSVEDAANRVANLLVDLQIERPVVVGYSMGGRVAMSLAAQRPGVPGGLAVVSASPGIIGESARAARRARDRQVAGFLRTWPEDRFLDFWYRQSVFRSLQRDRGLLEAAVGTRKIADKMVAARALVNYSPGQQKPVWNVLPALHGDLLYVAGSHDGKYVATGVRVVARARRARLAIVSGSGHIVHLERPRALEGTLRAFLERTSNWGN